MARKMTDQEFGKMIRNRDRISATVIGAYTGAFLGLGALVMVCLGIAFWVNPEDLFDLCRETFLEGRMPMSILTLYMGSGSAFGGVIGLANQMNEEY